MRSPSDSGIPFKNASSGAPLGAGAFPREAFLKTILSQPTAPFRESHVIRAITHEFIQCGVPHFIDPIGNIVIGASSKAEYLKLAREKTDEPLRIFIAHLDHPGFHGVSWQTHNRLEVKFHGGAPVQHLEGAAVWLADDEGWVAEGHMTDVKLTASGRTIDSAVIELPGSDRREERQDAQSLFGAFRFRDTHWHGEGKDNDLLYTKAADDLVGSFALASLALDQLGGTAPAPRGAKSAKGKKRPARSKKRPPFLALLTRAEEVGFIGTIGHFELGWLNGARRPLLGVSLETSRTLPGAEIGKGPVVRLGDKFTVFDSGALRVFSELAAKVLPGGHQRRIMDGGTCEATAATVYGVPCVGISVPLGNYHNQSFEGGPDSAGPMGPAPEFVSMSDIQGLIRLCKALIAPKLGWDKPWKSKHDEFRKELRKYRPLLKSRA